MTTSELRGATSEFAAPTGAEIMAAITEALAEIHRQGQGGYVGYAQPCIVPGQRA